MASRNNEIKIKIGNKLIKLRIEVTATQFDILRGLAQKFDEVFDINNKEKNLRPHICSLRKALDGTGYKIINFRGLGYKLTHSDSKEV